MKRIFNIVLAVIAVMMSASCEKSFELQRPNQEPWQSVDEFNLAIQSSYLYFTERPWANAIGMMALSGFGESDISWCLPGMSGNSYYYAYDQRTFKDLVLGSAKELEGAFMYLYDMSTTTNAALQFITDAEKAGKDPFTGMNDKDRAQMKEYKGELLFQRALAYWYIARKWAPPYNKENKDGAYFTMYRKYENNPDSLKNGKLATVESVYNAIISDLTRAVELLPEEYPYDPGSARMRPNKYVAEALKARILFYMGAEENKAEIGKLLDDVIGRNDLYQLTEEPYQAFNKVGDGYGKETIWQICYSSSSERYDRNPGVFNYYAFNTELYTQEEVDQGKGYKTGYPKCSGYCAFVMSFDAMVRVGWEEIVPVPGEKIPLTFRVTDEARMDKRFQQLYMQCIDTCSIYYKGIKNYGSPDLVFLWKYFRGSEQGSPAEKHANRPLIRLADLYLMRAEIRYLQNNFEGAKADLNVVRNRAGIGDFALPDKYLEYGIECERIKEMAGENADRINWLVGLKRDIPVGNRNLLYELAGQEGPYKPIEYPYSEMYYQVPVIEQQANSAYSK